jgi:AcrR family transcriptional regulator
MPQVNTRKRPETKPDAPTNARGERRREALLKAAREVFLDKGYAAASVEDVVGRVGGSKATLYSYFGSKEGLFDGMICGLCDELRDQLAIPREVDGDIELTLNRFGKRMLKQFLDPNRIAMHRAIFAEAFKFPRLAQRLYESGPQRGAQEFSIFLRRQHEARVLSCPEPETAAICFSEMIKAAPQRRAMLGLPAFKSEREMEKYIASAVRIFLHGSLPTKK